MTVEKKEYVMSKLHTTKLVERGKLHNSRKKSSYNIVGFFVVYTYHITKTDRQTNGKVRL